MCSALAGDDGKSFWKPSEVEGRDEGLGRVVLPGVKIPLSATDVCFSFESLNFRF